MFAHHHGRRHGRAAFGEERETNMGEGPFGRQFRRGRRMFEGGEETFGGRRVFGRGRRMFDGGELKLVFLALIEVEPRHGYDLIREVESRSSGAYAPSPGIVYPTLALLEDIGQIEARASEGAKKQFALNEAGKAFLDQNRMQANAALARLDEIGARAAPMEAGPIARAMRNLARPCISASYKGSRSRPPTGKCCSKSPTSSTRPRARSSGFEFFLRSRAA